MGEGRWLRRWLPTGCHRPTSGTVEPKPVENSSVPHPIAPQPRSGVVRLDARAFVDDGGPFLGIGASFLAAAWAYSHDRARLARNLRFLADRGVDYIRVLGSVAWTGRVVDPRSSDYDATIAGVTDLAFEHGLRVQWTIFGGVEATPTPESRLALVRRFVRMVAARSHKIQFIEVANEAWQNGFDGVRGRDEARALAAVLVKETPHPVAITSPPNARVGGQHAGTWWYAGSAATIYTAHLDRDIGLDGGQWAPVAAPWDVLRIPSIPQAWTNDEPIGPQSSVAQDDDPMRLAMSAAVTWAAGGAGYTLHTGPGVRFGGVEDVALGRAANFPEVPRIEEILAGLRATRGLLAADLPNWTRHGVGNAAHPFDAGPIKEDIGAGRLFRVFAASRGPRSVTLVLRVSGAARLRARRAMTTTVLHPLTGDTLQSRALAAGETLTLKETGIVRGTEVFSTDSSHSVPEVGR